MVPRRWTLHGLNNGLIFSATYHGVRTLPRAVSYAIGHVGTWLAWRCMTSTREAIADNLAPALSGREPRNHWSGAPWTRSEATRATRSIFCARLDAPSGDPRHLFDIVDEHRQVFESLLARGRGIVLITGHYGNWEVGSLLIRSALDLPLTIVAMAEADPTVNRIRLEIREKLGAETIEVRQSLDTALQIRRCLADNRIVAMLVDRHFGKDRVAVTLFGRAAWLLRTPLLMAHASGAPLLPCSIERIGPGRFKARPGKPIYVAARHSARRGDHGRGAAGGRRPRRPGS